MNLLAVDKLRLEASKRLDPARKSQLGQFMTPGNIAEYMAGLFTSVTKPVKLLDAGAGIGSLTTAFVHQYKDAPIQSETWEIEPNLLPYLEKTLSSLAANHSGLTSDIHKSDFIEDAVLNLVSGNGIRFTHAILNPPYKKINSNSKHRLLLRKVGVETVNLYSAFLALSILLMEDGGEIVAIIPRSFCNGSYYKSFRELLLRNCAIRHIHVFEHRDKAFADDDVLQENIIIKLEKTGTPIDVVISDCDDSTFGNYQEHNYPFEKIVKPGDAEMFIHVPVAGQSGNIASPLFKHTLKEIGLEVSTGPIVDFRMRESTSVNFHDGDAPLIYSHHFVDGKIQHPRIHKKKPNWIVDNTATHKWLMPKGWYVHIKRFSSKEEHHRIVANVVNPDELDFPFYGFENHANIIHVAKRGIDRDVAYGMSVFLNSTIVDAYFRAFSGHTQVNATDLRSMKFPAIDQIKKLGQWIGDNVLSQAELDALIGDLEKQQ